MIGSKLFFHMPTLEFSFWKGMQHQDSSCKNNTVVMHFKLYLFFFMQFNLLYRFKLHCGTKKNIMMRKKLTFNSKEQKFCKKNSFAWYLIYLEKSKHSFLKTKAKSPIIKFYNNSIYIDKGWHCQKSDTAQVFVETRPIKAMGCQTGP